MLTTTAAPDTLVTATAGAADAGAAQGEEEADDGDQDENHPPDYLAFAVDVDILTKKS